MAGVLSGVCVEGRGMEGEKGSVLVLEKGRGLLRSVELLLMKEPVEIDRLVKDEEKKNETAHALE